MALWQKAADNLQETDTVRQTHSTDTHCNSSDLNMKDNKCLSKGGKKGLSTYLHVSNVMVGLDSVCSRNVLPVFLSFVV